MVEDRIDKVEFTFRDRERFVLESSGPLIYTVRRRCFDQFLVQRAQSVGCQVKDGEPVEGLDLRKGRISVCTPRGERLARVLVGADGVSGAVARLGRFRRKRQIISTLQSEILMDSEALRQYRGRVWIGFGWIPNGYAWIFPKRDRLCVGMGAAVRGRRANVFRYAFRSLLGHLFPQHRDAPVSSFPISLGGIRQNLVRGRVLLVGEAANLVHPVTAEGIYYAVKSAQLAAEAVDDFLTQRTLDLEPYQRRVDEEIGSLFRKARIFSGLFYGLPHMSFRLFVKNNEKLIRYFGTEATDPPPG